MTSPRIPLSTRHRAPPPPPDLCADCATPIVWSMSALKWLHTGGYPGAIDGATHPATPRR